MARATQRDYLVAEARADGFRSAVELIEGVTTLGLTPEATAAAMRAQLDVLVTASADAKIAAEARAEARKPKPQEG